MKRKAFKIAFPYTLPTLTGFLFLGAAYGIYMNVNGFSFIYPLFMSMLIYGGFCNARGILPEKHGRYQCAARSAGICRRCLYCRCARLAQKYAPFHYGGTAMYALLLHFVG